MSTISRPIIKQLPRSDYQTIWQQMRDFTLTRNVTTPDEIWLLEHNPVFTQGQAGKPEHVLNSGSIPVIQTDRGGQVTYHGPGQLMIYCLINLRRQKIGVKQYVAQLEQMIITLLNRYNITAKNRLDAPGVYVDNAKICSIGLKISRGCSYHGLALNVAMNLEPFNRINPCGFRNLTMTQIQDFVDDITITKLITELTPILNDTWSY